MMNAAGAQIDTTKTLLASMVDKLEILIWQRTKDGQKGKNKPESILQKLMEKPKPKPNMQFSSGKDLMDYWNRAVEERTHG